MGKKIKCYKFSIYWNIKSTCYFQLHLVKITTFFFSLGLYKRNILLARLNCTTRMYSLKKAKQSQHIEQYSTICQHSINEIVTIYFFPRKHTLLTQSINEPLIFASCRDCPSYLASAETVHDLLHPAKTTVQEKWLPAETVSVILLPAETLGRKLNHMDSLCRKVFSKYNSIGRKQEIADSLGRSQIHVKQTVSAGGENWRTRLYPVVNVPLNYLANN